MGANPHGSLAAETQNQPTPTKANLEKSGDAMLRVYGRHVAARTAWLPKGRADETPECSGICRSLFACRCLKGVIVLTPAGGCLDRDPKSGCVLRSVKQGSDSGGRSARTIHIISPTLVSIGWPYCPIPNPSNIGKAFIRRFNDSPLLFQ